jgi:hypothetical protein
MPPRSVNKVLTADQIDTLKRWIAQGAQYKPHWSFIAPAKPVPPSLKQSARVANDIDRFVLARLEQEHIAPSPETDRRTLIRRLSFDLVGLPPTLSEVDAFLKDGSRGVYEKVVDRLLASPARRAQAAYWLNIARYSESDGFWTTTTTGCSGAPRLGDRGLQQEHAVRPVFDLAAGRRSDASPYQRADARDGVLESGKRTTENGALDEEYRVEYAVDRANTVGIGFLGMTVVRPLPRHKHDPISHRFLRADRLLQQHRRAGLLCTG